MYNQRMNKKFGKEYHREYYKKRRQEILDYLGGACVVCGTSDSLEVDHINKTEKSFNISKKMSVKNNSTELDKCQLLCQKHHREKTSRENSGFTHGTRHGYMNHRCTCPKCSAAKRAWYDERNAKRRKGPGYGPRV